MKANDFGAGKVLVVDDEEDFRELVAFNLRGAGCEVVAAANGLEALECARRERPDLVLLDLMLPEMDGISVCEMLRRIPATATTPILMVSAWSTDQSRLVGLQAGATDYLTKPVSPRELTARVKSLLASSRAATAEPELRLEKLLIDVDNNRVKANGREVELTTREFKLLTLLIQAILDRLDPGAPNPKSG